MSSLPLESNLSEEVGRCLEDALPTATLSRLQVADQLPSVLVLRFGELLVAFAFGDDDSTYPTLYNAFKTHFKSRGQEWNALDVAFVYCLPPEVTADESFRSRIETDTFFCRKFVIYLGHDLVASLARLPFLPLSRLQSTPLRPPSAQTLLLQSGIHVDLARFLVVPYLRSPQTIVTDCLSGRFGPPQGIGGSVPHPRMPAERTDLAPAKLQSLTIKNFRAYRSSKTFELGSAITVLYGPNGFGKTSFFDALDFAVTGGVGRLKKASSEQALSKAAKHLDSGDEESVVSLTFRHGDEVHSVTRSLTKPSLAKLDGREGVSRKEVLTLLTGGEAPPDRVENLIDLFRATHLFSQEGQELTKDFQDNCELSEELVSRMLAFDDYVKSIGKSSEIQGLLQAATKKSKEELARLQLQVSKDRQELARLESVSAVAANREAIEADLAGLRQELGDVGIDARQDIGAADVSLLKSWRAELESLLAEQEARVDRLTEAKSDLHTVRRLQHDDRALAATINQQEQTLSQVAAQRQAVATSQQDAAVSVSEAVRAEERSTALNDWMVWFASARPEYNRLKHELEALSPRVKELDAQRTGLNSRALAIGSTLHAHETSLKNASGRMRSETARLQALSSLRADVGEADAATARLKEIGEVEATLAESRLSGRRNLDHVNEALAQVQSDASSLAAQVEALESQTSDIKSLITQLRAHVVDGTCLLCGDEHGSKSILLARVDARLASEGELSIQRARLLEKRAAIAALTASEVEYRTSLEALVQRQNDLAIERQSYLDRLTEFAQRAAALGLTWPLSDLDAAIRQSQEGLDLLAAEHETHSRSKDLALADQTEVNLAIAEISAAFSAAEEARLRTARALEQLAADARRGGLDLEISDGDFETALQQSQRAFQVARQVTQAARATLEQRDAELSRKTQEADSLKRAIARLRSESEATMREASRLLLSIGRFELNSESSDEGVDQLAAFATAQVAKLRPLMDRAARLEIALDAATTSAALESLRNSVKHDLALIETSVIDRDRYEQWSKYFRSVENLLDQQRSAATELFTRGYGPRTAVIQNRLRPVYGFGEIKVSSRGGSIRVEVVRNGEALKPTDYFSQSQVQTLLLGLFLTAASSQTWSAFSSVMMDDPVTHFDDLNVYALLDLIAGLLRSPDGSLQFVLSTCDEKLLQLARQKFRHLSDEAKFYRFSALGADGPLVNEIPLM